MSEYRHMTPTRVQRPRELDNIVHRVRLFDALDEGARGTVTCVSAPAGWGKSALLASWAERRTGIGTFGWLSIEAGEDPSSGFWGNVIAALESGCPADEREVLTGLVPPRSSAADHRAFLSILISAISQLPQPVVLVIDDVHLIERPAVLAQISYFLSHAQSRLHVVLSGHDLPDIDLTKLTLARQVRQLRTDDLAFTGEELRELFNGDGLTVDESTNAALLKRTQGWAAGLQMIALAGRDKGAGDRRTVDVDTEVAIAADYLMRHVLEKLPADTQEFLVAIAVAGTVSPDLAEALTGAADASTQLGDLTRRGLFVSSLSGVGDWFVVHPLMADFLVSILERTSPDLANSLNARAANWFAEHDDLVRALNHAVRARSGDLAGPILDELWPTLYAHDDLTTLQSVVAEVERAAVGIDVEALRTLLYAAEGDVINYETSTQTGEKAARPGQQLASLDLAHAIGRLAHASLIFDLPEAEAASEAALELVAKLPAGVANEIRAIALMHRGTVAQWTGQSDLAQQTLRRALAGARRARLRKVELRCLSELAVATSSCDHFRDAAELAEQAMALAESMGWTHTAEAVSAWHAMGWLGFVHGDLDRADQCYDAAEDAARLGDQAARGIIKCDQAVVLAVRGDTDGAIYLMQEARQILDRVAHRQDLVFTGSTTCELARLYAIAGQRTRALDTIRQEETLRKDTVPLALAKGELHLANGNYPSAVAALTPAVEGSLPGYLPERIEARLMLAVAESRRNNRRRAIALIEQAVNLAYRDDLRVSFLRFGADLAQYSADLPSSTDDPRLDFIRRALVPRAPERRARQPIDPLSERELEVLRYLSGVWTIPEIAAELIISVNTVKAHVKAIYRKLAVSNRRSAVRQAEALGLL